MDQNLINLLNGSLSGAGPISTVMLHSCLVGVETVESDSTIDIMYYDNPYLIVGHQTSMTWVFWPIGQALSGWKTGLDGGCLAWRVDSSSFGPNRCQTLAQSGACRCRAAGHSLRASPIVLATSFTPTIN